MSFNTLRTSKPGLHEVLAAHFFEAHRNELPIELTVRHVQWLYLAVEAARCSYSLRVVRAPFRHAWQRLLTAGFPVAFREALLRVGVLGTLKQLPHLGGQSGDFLADTRQLAQECKQAHIYSKPHRLTSTKLPCANQAAAGLERIHRLIPEDTGANQRSGSVPRPATSRNLSGAPEVEFWSARAFAEACSDKFLNQNQPRLPIGMTTSDVRAVFLSSLTVMMHRSGGARAIADAVWTLLLKAGFPARWIYELRHLDINPALVEMVKTLRRLRPVALENPLEERVQRRSSWPLEPIDSNLPASASCAPSDAGWVPVDFKQNRRPRSADFHTAQVVSTDFVDYREQYSLPIHLLPLQHQADRPQHLRGRHREVGNGGHGRASPETSTGGEAHESLQHSHRVAALDASNYPVRRSPHPISDFLRSQASPPRNGKAKRVMKAWPKATDFSALLNENGAPLGVAGMGKTGSLSKIERLRLAAPQAKRPDDDDKPAEEPVI